jgi:squalene-associated FAD-dependent desaturase
MAGRVAIVGAGYAGLACAVELADAGINVDIFEASRTLGGRARAVELDGLTVDNGTHILVGAYRETLRVLRKVGADETALNRRSLHLEFADGFRLSAPKLPAPLHMAWALLTARGLAWTDKLAAIRFMRQQQSRHFRLPQDTTAAALFAEQPERLRRYLWEPLCLAALNTPVAIASAQVFLNVLRDSLAADRAASDLLLPTTDLSKLFPEPAAKFIEAHGGKVHRSRRITSLNELSAFQHKVFAVAPYHLADLLPDLTLPPFHWQPIATVYLQYPADTLLPCPMLGMSGPHAQWLFDRGVLCGQPGLIAVIISGEGTWQVMDHEVLAATIHNEIATNLPNWPAPLRHWVIEEKRATFSCTPELERPAAAIGDNLWLAGDHVAGDYPATLEGAVRSGIAVARSILGHLTAAQP